MQCFRSSESSSVSSFSRSRINAKSLGHPANPPIGHGPESLCQDPVGINTPHILQRVIVSVTTRANSDWSSKKGFSFFSVIVFVLVFLLFLAPLELL